MKCCCQRKDSKITPENNEYKQRSFKGIRIHPSRRPTTHQINIIPQVRTILFKIFRRRTRII